VLFLLSSICFSLSFSRLYLHSFPTRRSSDLILYESGGWLISLLITILLSVYFLIRWIVHKFTFNKIYLYGFLLALATLCIFRFIFSISMEGIKLMPDHIKFI